MATRLRAHMRTRGQPPHAARSLDVGVGRCRAPGCLAAASRRYQFAHLQRSLGVAQAQQVQPAPPAQPPWALWLQAGAPCVPSTGSGRSQQARHGTWANMRSADQHEEVHDGLRRQATRGWLCKCCASSFTSARRRASVSNARNNVSGQLGGAPAAAAAVRAWRGRAQLPGRPRGGRAVRMSGPADARSLDVARAAVLAPDIDQYAPWRCEPRELMTH